KRRSGSRGSTIEREIVERRVLERILQDEPDDLAPVKSDQMCPTARSPELSSGWDPALKSPSTVVEEAQAKEVSPHRFRFVVPMVVLADINGKIYRLTTHYTIASDRPKLDFKPLTIKFDERLLWERSNEIAQKIDLDTITSCSTGQGTFTEHDPIEANTQKNKA
ncbi:hypothetical protein OSTOST_18399, partial [Ostertagia ostertagi]